MSNFTDEKMSILPLTDTMALSVGMGMHFIMGMGPATP